MNNTTARRRYRAGLAAAAAAAVALIGAAGPAFAAPLVDPDAVGSITVHKYEAPDSPVTLPNDGTEVDTTGAGLVPLSGVEFTVQQVNTIDLSTNQGWTDAEDLSDVFDATDPAGSITGAGYTLGAGTAVTTDASGEAVFSGLPVGLYLVEETAYPSGVTPAAPFLITIPLTDPNNLDNWLYDVHVYPKNAIAGVTKTVEDLDAVEFGDLVTWTITADIPNVQLIDGYKIVDQLDEKLDYVDAVVTLADGTSVTEGTDYNVVFDAATNTVTVEFTAAGRAVLAANNTTEVVVDIQTTVNTVGEIANTALLYPNLPSFDIDPGEPGGPVETPEVETRWGGLTVEKVDDNSDALAGAQFQVFTSLADAEAQTNPVADSTGATTFTADASGLVEISGLRYSDFANGVTVAPGDAGYIQYYLVEVVAPSGYELLAEPIEFIVDAATSAVGVDLRSSTSRATPASSCPSRVARVPVRSTWSASV